MAAELHPPGDAAGEWLRSVGLGDFAAPAVQVIERSVAAGATAEVEAAFTKLKSLYDVLHKRTPKPARVRRGLEKACETLVVLRAKSAHGSPLYDEVTVGLTATFKVITAQVAACLSPNDEDSAEDSDGNFNRAEWAPQYAPWVNSLHAALVDGDISGVDGRFGFDGRYLRFDATELEWSLSLWNTISACPAPMRLRQRGKADTCAAWCAQYWHAAGSRCSGSMPRCPTTRTPHPHPRSLRLPQTFPP